MKFSEIQLPSNKKFGYFFSIVFALISAYLFIKNNIWAYFFSFATVSFLLTTILKADLLLPLNKIWMRFGFLLGMIVSPVVLGIIFFGLFTPIALLMRLVGRDELKLKLENKSSQWTLKDNTYKGGSFRSQF